jgi:hypothetical protein
MVSNHQYQRNGLGAVDDNGEVPCGRCGLPRGSHTRPGPDPASRWPDGQPVTPWADPWHDIAGDIRDQMRAWRDDGLLG